MLAVKLFVSWFLNRSQKTTLVASINMTFADCFIVECTILDMAVVQPNDHCYDDCHDQMHAKLHVFCEIIVLLLLFYYFCCRFTSNAKDNSCRVYDNV